MWASNVLKNGFRGWTNRLLLDTGSGGITEPRHEVNRKGGRATVRAAPARAGLDKFLQNKYVRSVFRNMKTCLRRRCVPIAVVLSDDPEGAKLTYGWVLDRSLGGLCVSADARRTEGTSLFIRATNATETSPWAEVLVKGCRRDGRRWDLDCTFAEAPLHNLLFLFG
jgi:hypothetical protein